MGKHYKILILVFFALSLSVQNSFGQCTDVDKERKKSLLGNAVYDNYRQTYIKNAKDPYDIEFRVDLLKNFNFKLIFDMKAKSEGVIVKLFDVGEDGKEVGNLLYQSSEDIMTENATFEIQFEAPKTKLLVKYEVKDETYEGCVLFMLGVYLRDKKAKKTKKK